MSVADAKRNSRELVLQILFQKEFAANSSSADLYRYFRQTLDIEPVDWDFGLNILNGIENKMDDIDNSLKEHSRHWNLERMALVDLSLLRLAGYELIYTETPAKVVINEAVEIAKKYSTTDSSSFVNGLLDALAGKVRT